MEHIINSSRVKGNYVRKEYCGPISLLERWVRERGVETVSRRRARKETMSRPRVVYQGFRKVVQKGTRDLALGLAVPGADSGGGKGTAYTFASPIDFRHDETRNGGLNANFRRGHDGHRPPPREKGAESDHT